jgi:hypothetical protein
MTPVKAQIDKFLAEKSCQVVFNVLGRLYSIAVVTRGKLFVHGSVLPVCMYCYCAALLVTCLEEKS